MKLSIVIPVLNQHELVRAVLDQLYATIPADTEVVILDNGSTTPFKHDKATVVRFHKTIGVYPTFADGFKYTSGDVVAFFHSDLVVWEGGWITRMLDRFENNPKLGMIGFIGSNEIDSSGGRGLGTTSNFKGLTLIEHANEGQVLMAGVVTLVKMWSGSHASMHGRVSDAFSNAAVVDGCAMIIRREAWNRIGVREDFPPHHFYDRLISTQLLEHSWEVGVLGIACDHFSGQTVAHEDVYHKMAMEWCEVNKLLPVTTNGVLPNWDATIYQEAERRWLKEYRDEKHLIPIRV